MDLQALSPVPWQNVYHIGMVVPDVAAAAKSIAAEMGISFGSVRPVTVGVRAADGSVGPETILIAYGTDGPPYLELIEGTAHDSVWRAEGGPRVHHVGVWVDDLPGEMARLTRLGLRTDASGAGADGRPQLFAYMTNALGLTVELVDASGRDGFLQRLTG